MVFINFFSHHIKIFKSCLRIQHHLCPKKCISVVEALRAVRKCWFEKDVPELNYIEIDLHEGSKDRWDTIDTELKDILKKWYGSFERDPR
jgi:hypothetical protein